MLVRQPHPIVRQAVCAGKCAVAIGWQVGARSPPRPLPEHAETILPGIPRLVMQKRTAVAASFTRLPRLPRGFQSVILGQRPSLAPE